MIKLLESALICSYSFVSNLNVHKQKNKIVFIPFFGRLGDMIMFMDTLDEYKKMFVIERGYHLILGCRSEAWKILKINGMDYNLEFFELTRENLKKYKYFKDRVREIRKRKPEIIINVRENNAIEHIYLHAIPAVKKYTYRSYQIRYVNRMGSFFSKHTYTTIWTDQENKDQISCYADMVRLLGHKNYKSKIRRFPYFTDKMEGLPDDYVAICPGASIDNKCWPVERYINVINHILECTNTHIVICGGKNDISIAKKICNKIQTPSKVFDLTGQTSIEQWITILQNAIFVLTNESGSIHIAASCGVPSICIGEQKYSNKWLPYRVEYVRDDDCFPTVVRGPILSCEFCAAVCFSYDEECKKCYHEHGVVRCVYEVTEEKIISEVDRYIGAYCNAK